MMAIGHSNKEIAAELGTSASKRSRCTKPTRCVSLELRGRIDVVRYAILHGWLREP